MSRDALFRALRDYNVFARRYFFPLISDFPMYRGFPSAHRDNLPVAADIANRVLCLPIYPDLETEQIELIVRIIAGR